MTQKISWNCHWSLVVHYIFTRFFEKIREMSFPISIFQKPLSQSTKKNRKTYFSQVLISTNWLENRQSLIWLTSEYVLFFVARACKTYLIVMDQTISIWILVHNFIWREKTFLSKIQNRISEKTGKKILLLYGKISR